MADVNISKYRASVVRDGSKPASPGFVVSEGQDPVNPPGTNNYVPYSGATANVELGEFGVEAGFVTLDTTPTNIPTDQGAIYWDDTRSTAALIMNGTLQHIGQDSFFYVKNSSGSTIPKGTCVGFAGTDGASGHLLVTPFLANGSVPSIYFMGVTAEAITNGSFGQVMHFGELEGINTSGFTAGALLYASTTVAGGFQTTVPVAPNNIVLVAAAVNSKNNGAIVVRPTYGSNINIDEGVKITSPTTGDLLQLQAGGLWENKTKAQILGGTSSQFVKGDGSLDSTSYQPLLTNPVTGTGTTNYLPKFTGTSSIGNSIVQDAGIRVDIGGDIRLTPSSAVNIQAYTGSVYTNLFYNAASHNWQTSGGATKMFLNSNDNLLIGTTSDNGARLQVSGNVYIARSSNPYLTIDDTGVNSEGGILFKPSGFNSKGGLTINYSTAEQRLFVGEGGNSYFQTFYTNGSERLRITSSGNLGLGITPSAWNSAYRAMQFGTTGAIFGESGDAANYFTTNTFVDSVGFKYITSDWALGYFQENGVHSWRNAPSGTAGNAISFTQAMTLFATGNLLVGSPSPISDNGARLQVSGTATVSGLLSLDNSTSLALSINSSTNNPYIRFQQSGVSKFFIGERSATSGDGGTGYDIYAASGNDLRFFAGATKALTLASTGAATFSSSVTASGGVNAGDSKFFNSVQLTDSLGGTCQGFLWTDAANTLKIGTGTVAGVNVKMTITSSGNVGIGTSSPGSLLTLSKAGSHYVQFVNSSTSNNTWIGNNSGDAWIEAGGAYGILFQTNGTERMRITSGGNVLIGTTTNGSSKLKINGLPTSSAGLASGDVWNDGGTLKIA